MNDTPRTEPVQDARFEDAPLSDKPLRLRAESAEDLAVISALVQDAVARAGDVMYLPRKRRVVVLINRFRWEDAGPASAAGRPFERVRTAMTIEDAMGLRARGIGRGDGEAVLSVLALSYTPEAAAADTPPADAPPDPEATADTAGTLSLTCAGGAEFSVAVEALTVTLADLTRPWEAQGSRPDHPDA
ncbi:MAG: DUF2948 family protein [Pseudomonadota bacterium]